MCNTLYKIMYADPEKAPLIELMDLVGCHSLDIFIRLLKKNNYHEFDIPMIEKLFHRCRECGYGS
jgi:hypothetical protein